MTQGPSSVFINRLENWGAYYRTLKRPGTSATYDVCSRLVKDAGQGYRESRIKEDVDQEDAQIIEWCWCRASHRLNVKHHAMLKAHFIDKMDTRIICRLLRIRYLSYGNELDIAMEIFENCVEIFENIKYSHDHQLLTTA